MRLVLFCLLLFSTTASAVELRVATAANFYPTLKKIKQAYEQQSEDSITIIRGSTGKLYAQILKGAPFDLFLAADARRPELLVKKSLALDNQAALYATGQLAVWQTDADSSQQIREILINGDFKKLAIANPKTAPYGAASIEVLKEMELYNELKSKLVYGENIAQTLQFVQSGSAELGFVARSYVMHDIFWEVEPESHKPIAQKMIIVKRSKHKEAAKSFYHFLQSSQANAIKQSDGYQ